MKPSGIHSGSHHASERQQCGLDLRHVAALKQIVGLKYIMRLQAVHGDGFGEGSQVLQLKTHTPPRKTYCYSNEHRSQEGLWKIKTRLETLKTGYVLQVEK